MKSFLLLSLLIFTCQAGAATADFKKDTVVLGFSSGSQNTGGIAIQRSRQGKNSFYILRQLKNGAPVASRVITDETYARIQKDFAFTIENDLKPAGGACSEILQVVDHSKKAATGAFCVSHWGKDRKLRLRAYFDRLASLAANKTAIYSD